VHNAGNMLFKLEVESLFGKLKYSAELKQIKGINYNHFKSLAFHHCFHSNLSCIFLQSFFLELFM